MSCNPEHLLKSWTRTSALAQLRKNRSRTLSIASLEPAGGASALRRAATNFADRALALDKLDAVYSAIPRDGGVLTFLNACVDTLGVTRTVSGTLESIPAHGPAVIVANHPFGGLDGLLLAQLLLQRRPDVRILTNRFLSSVPELAEITIPIEVFGMKRGIAHNAARVRDALRWVRAGGLLALFPAGEVAQLNVAAGAVIDPPWTESAARIVRACRAPVIPVHFNGRNSWLFQIAGLMHSSLRTALLPREFLNKAHRHIEINVGRPIDTVQIAAVDGNDALAGFLRLQTYALAEGARSNEPALASSSEAAPIVAAVDRGVLSAEVAALSAARRLASSGELTAFVTTQRASPRLIEEIGRLREATFRAAGEGTGGATDVDVFDAYYEHLFIWHEQRREVVGAYRIGRSDEILWRRGLSGLYTSKLFRYTHNFFTQLPPALELGRSFVRVEYQRSFAPLSLLWKGIAAYVARNPHYAVLFGAVSISDAYHPISKELLCEFLSRAHFAPQLARCVKPRQKVRRNLSLNAVLHPLEGSAMHRFARRDAERARG